MAYNQNRSSQRNESSTTVDSEILHLDTGLFTIQDIPGKGKGVVATQTIAPGTCIVAEAPVLTTECLKSAETDEIDLGNELKKRPKGSQRAYLSLCNAFPEKGKPITSIFRSNAYAFGRGSEHGGVFLVTSRFNHSCRPNAQHRYNPLLEKETVYSIQPIEIGEEITLSYHHGGTSSQRKADLKEYFRFDCTCDACSLPEDQLAVSDARLIRAQELNEQIGSHTRAYNTPELALADCRELLKIYQEEKIADLRMPNLYYDAFQIAAMHSDQARAKTFANRYRQLIVVAEGPDSVDALEMMSFARKPSSHASFGSTKLWASTVKSVPKDLEAENFERWLWREPLLEKTPISAPSSVKKETDLDFLTWPNA